MTQIVSCQTVLVKVGVVSCIISLAWAAYSAWLYLPITRWQLTFFCLKRGWLILFMCTHYMERQLLSYYNACVFVGSCSSICLWYGVLCTIYMSMMCCYCQSLISILSQGNTFCCVCFLINWTLKSTLLE